MFIPVPNPHPGSRGSVADPGCSSQIPDPQTATKEKGENKLVAIPFFVAKFYKIENYFIFEMLKIWATFQRIIDFFTQKIATKLSKIGDPGCEIRKKPI
jgi:hypothetical protein